MTAEAAASHRGWRIAYWLLTAGFIGTAALNLLRIRAGFFTSHAADLIVPAWLYVVMRGFTGVRHRLSTLRWLGSTPELAAGSLFVASSLTEFSQKLWPEGPFRGTFDPLDLLAYAAGLLVCYAADKLEARRAAAGA